MYVIRCVLRSPVLETLRFGKNSLKEKGVQYMSELRLVSFRDGNLSSACPGMLTKGVISACWNLLREGQVQGTVSEDLYSGLDGCV